MPARDSNADAERTNPAPLSRPFRYRVAILPVGSSVVRYGGHSYAITKSVHSGGRTVKLYAEQLGGNDIVSFNLFALQGALLLKPCEMPSGKVIAFVENFQFESSSATR